MKTKSWPASRIAPWIAPGLGFSVLYLPLFALGMQSFQTVEGSWTLQWYRQVFSEPLNFKALLFSFVIASITAIVTAVLSTGYALKTHGQRRADGLMILPMILPELVLGISLLIWFSALGIELGLVTIVLAHITFTMSYGVLAVRANLEGMDPQLAEAARDLGASTRQIFWKITFPLLLPGILTGAALAFVLSFDDFLVTYFTSGSGQETLPVRIYSMIRYGVSREIHALSTLLVITTLGLTFAVFKSRSKTRDFNYRSK